MTTGDRTNRAVTIVIPMYGHLDSLERCITSVIDFVDLQHHRVILMNDSGPEVENVEKMVLELIAGRDNMSYHRNAENVGFVTSCNRAVLEIDGTDNDILLLNSDARLTSGALEEMISVLYHNEKHGVVFPRSTNASIASVPLLPLDAEYSEHESLAVYTAMQPHLPRFSITPIAVGFCFLVRRDLISNYGFFDEAYSPGYSEENDFCLRVAKYGYSSVLSHESFVFHEGSRSFHSAVRDELKEQHGRLLLERYPFYDSAVIHYLQFWVEPADWFADRLFGSGRKRVLIDLYHLSLLYNGSTRNALTFLELLARTRDELDFDVTIVSSHEAIEFFDLKQYGFPVAVNGQLSGTFDLGFALAPPSSWPQLFTLNRHCVRWMVSHFDVIALRIQALLEVSIARRQVVLDSLRFADRVVAISNSALDDLDAYFGFDGRAIRERSIVLHEGVAAESFVALGDAADEPTESTLDLPAHYVLVIGNVFTHKQLPEALHALRGLASPVVAFGAMPSGHTVPEGVLLVEGGHLSDQSMDELYRGAACVVFPSAYEGFGLPIAETAQRGRPLVLFDTEVAHEVVESLGIAATTRYFQRFSELPAVVDGLITAPPAPSTEELRTIEAYNRDLVDELTRVLEGKVDLEVLRSRTMYFRALELAAEPSAHDARMHQQELSAIKASRSWRLARIATRRLSFLRVVLRPVARVVRRMRAARIPQN